MDGQFSSSSNPSSQALGHQSRVTEATYNPYEPFDKSPQPAFSPDGVNLSYAAERSNPVTAQLEPEPQREKRSSNVYWGISGVLGFRERYSLILFVVCGGAILGFCLARAQMMSPTKVKDLTVPGEWFWYHTSIYKPAIFLHIYCTLIAAFFSIFQFFPAIRRRNIFWHRLNGYLVLLLLIPGIVSGAVVGRRAFGGSVATQAAFYTIALLIVFSAFAGYAKVKNTRLHRRWMLRTVTYLGTPITARVIMVISRGIITIIGTYYTIWSCAELQFLQTMNQGVPDFSNTYPICTTASLDPSSVLVTVQASTRGTPANFASSVRETFGMGLWLSLFLHALGIETYLRLTESTNQYRRGFVLERDVPDVEKFAGDR